MNSKYSEFLPSVQNREDLVAEVEGLSMDIDLLKAAIENEVTPRGHSAPFHPKSVAPPQFGVFCARAQGVSGQPFHGGILGWVAGFDDPGGPFQLRRFCDSVTKIPG